MSKKEYFNEVPKISLYDPLSHVLGSFEDGIIDFYYEEIAKVTGHSCPTVASSYIAVMLALKHLYKDALPTRGDIKVFIKKAKSEDTAGVLALVASTITGALDEGGFKGLGGRFARNNRLVFGADILGNIEFLRIDTNEKVTLQISLNNLPNDPNLSIYFPKAINFEKEGLELFWEAWHSRVKQVLFEYERYKIVTIL